MKEVLPSHNPTDVKLNDLIELGAVDVDELFSVASPGQHEVLLNEKRFLITPNDAEYKSYIDTLEGSGFNFLVGDQKLSDDQVIVGEIPRDSRHLGHIAYTAESQGLTPTEVFFMAGSRIADFIDTKGVSPEPEDVDLRKILFGKSSMEFMIAPPMQFVEASNDSRSAVINAVHGQLDPDYIRFNGLALETAFERGLD